MINTLRKEIDISDTWRIYYKEGTIEYNKGKQAIKLEVVNTGDRPIQIGSHYHFTK